MSYGKCNLPSVMITKATKTKNLIPIIMIYFSVVCSKSLCLCVEWLSEACMIFKKIFQTFLYLCII